MQKPRYGPQPGGDDGDTIADTESKKSRSHSQSIKRNQKPGLRGDWRQANVWDTTFKSTLGTKYLDTLLQRNYISVHPSLYCHIMNLIHNISPLIVPLQSCRCVTICAAVCVVLHCLVVTVRNGAWYDLLIAASTSGTGPSYDLWWWDDSWWWLCVNTRRAA